MTDTPKIPDLKSVDSSNVSHIGYEPGERRLWVRFKSGGLYSYDDVAPHRYDDFMAADSKGRHFKENILGKFPHRRVEEKAKSDAG